MSTPSAMPTGARWAVLLLLSTILVTTAMNAGYRGLADLYYYPVKKFLGTPGQKGEPRRLTIEQAKTLLSDARRWDENNPDSLRAKAQVLAKKAEDRFFWQSVDMVPLNDSLGYTRKALQLRPSSPWLWADIAMVKMMLGEYDDEMEGAMLRASELGPWQPLVQIQLAHIGMAIWPRLSGSARQAVLSAIHRGLRRKARYLIPIVKKYERESVLCESLAGEPAIETLCSLR